MIKHYCEVWETDTVKAVHIGVLWLYANYFSYKLSISKTLKKKSKREKKEEWFSLLASAWIFYTPALSKHFIHSTSEAGSKRVITGRSIHRKAICWRNVGKFCPSTWHSFIFINIILKPFVWLDNTHVKERDLNKHSRHCYLISTSTKIKLNFGHSVSEVHFVSVYLAYEKAQMTSR